MNSKIIYTITDEAPMLATYSLLPIVKAFARKAEIEIDTKDISLAARILSVFPEYLEESQRTNDALSELGDLVKLPEANIIKLPNISASLPQLIETINELQSKGYNIPGYPENPINDKQKAVKSIYDKVKGSAVNPVLREGNSDRRAPRAVKNYARENPHFMGVWNPDSKSHVATMHEGDFRHNEKSVCLSQATDVKIELFTNEGHVISLKESISLLDKEIIDVSVMSKKSLLSFLEREMKDAREKDVLISLHMKATMMKVSDPIIFGYAVNVFFKELIDKHHQTFDELDVDFRNGFGDLINKISSLSVKKRVEIDDDIERVLLTNADLAMVDSDKGITNFHIPSDVIIDASMPAMIRSSGQMWNKFGELQDTKAIIPDSSYASIYIAAIEFCKKYGAFDPSTMGTVPNVGLMAKKAEEYGSHDKTFEIVNDGIVRVTDLSGRVLIEKAVAEGDIWRMCQTKDSAVKDWVSLAVKRAKATGWPAVFWLDENRAHDSELISKVKVYLEFHDISSLDIRIMNPYEATLFTLKRVKNGDNTISVTGNVLRDYLTDLFPILELGTSAKMLSIVPLMNGGGLFETGAGGSAPKHVQQFIQEGHLRWDSLGEFLALVASLDHLADIENNSKAKVLAESLDRAIECLLKNRKSPKRKVGELDNRGSHFYLAMYWSYELASQQDDIHLSSIFTKIHTDLELHESSIIEEITNAQGKKEEIGGYYLPEESIISFAMRPSKTFNNIIDSM